MRAWLGILALFLASPASAQWGASTGYFDIDDAGNITVTSTGATAINAAIGNTSFYLTLDATDAQGAVEHATANIFTCCTYPPTDGPLTMPWRIVKQATAPPPNDQGFYQWANATVELSVAVDPSQIAEAPTISFDGVVKHTCIEQPQSPPPPAPAALPIPQRWCLYSLIDWDASKGQAHVIEGSVKLTDGNTYKTTLQIPATFRMTLFWSPNDDGVLYPVSDDIGYRSQVDCVARAQEFFTPAANPQGLIKHYTCEGP